MIVIDASAAISALLNDGPARRTLVNSQAHAPHLIDLEVLQVLRRHADKKVLTNEQAAAAVSSWQQVTLSRHPHADLAARIWAHRHNLSAYDAAYISLAEVLQTPLVTLDARLAAAPGIACEVTVLPG